MKTLLAQEKTQMASIHVGEIGDCYDLRPPDSDSFSEPEIPPCFNESVDEFGEPEISPRIGDEYQVTLPPLTQYYTRKCSKSGAKPHINRKSHPKHDLNTYFKAIKQETAEDVHDSPTAEKTNNCNGLAEPCWNALEKESFLLGLYIFEKNFVNVRRFVETKEMGCVLSFYYGNFYSSPEYHRWSDCRKMKGKKGIYGERIFSGSRQHELLHRILPCISEESRDAALKMSKTFEGEKASLSEYVFYLKMVVGVKILVDAVGIGKGKLDLTEMLLEPSRPVFPSGRAFSSLTTNELIKILTGDYRLSKARSNDIFWEAIWPRLLERGWQTVLPGKHTAFSQSRPYLVYLVPGVTKFSRRKLVKGEHYFDSTTDILALVSKQPDLIVLDSERVDCNKKEEKIEAPVEEKFEKRSEKHSYLQPRTPKRESDVKFMVVDTSLPDGNIQELRPFPPEIAIDDDDTCRERASGSNRTSMAESSKKTTFLPDPKEKKVSLEEKSRTNKVYKSKKAKRAGSGHEGPAVKRFRCETKVSYSGDDKAIEWKSPPQFDLNIPLEAENAELGIVQGIDCRVSVRGNEICPAEENADPNGPENGMINEVRPTQIAGLGLGKNNAQPLSSNPLRLSTRTRPLTRRVIEAVEGGYLMGDHRRRRARTTALGKNQSQSAARSGGGGRQVVCPIDQSSHVGGGGESNITNTDSGISGLEK